MITLYRLITTIVGLVIYPYGRLRAVLGSQRWRERLGLIATDQPVDLWLHAASVGEAKVMAGLVLWLKQARGNLRIYVTSMTPLGCAAAAEMIKDQARIGFFPLDAPLFMRRSLNRLNPRMVVVAETEIWPSLISEISYRELPLLLVNGRMSRKSASRYQRIRKTMARLLSVYEKFFFKSDDDRGRYANLGMPETKAVVAGDMKFDAPLPERDPVRITAVRKDLGLSAEHFLLVAGSTRPGEEQALLQLWRSLGFEFPQFRLIMAPRHLDRLAEVTALAQSRSIPIVAYGTCRELIDNHSVTLVDQMGLLNDLYLAADLAFVGGTLVPIGGHNILEPVWAGTPVLFGPSLDNVADAANYVVTNGYGDKVADADELTSAVRECILGTRTFVRKTETDQSESATARAGQYILDRLRHA